MNFDKYYAALLRTKTQTEPRADEAMKDFQRLLHQTWLAAVA